MRVFNFVLSVDLSPHVFFLFFGYKVRSADRPTCEHKEGMKGKHSKVNRFIVIINNEFVAAENKRYGKKTVWVISDGHILVH